MYDIIQHIFKLLYIILILKHNMGEGPIKTGKFKEILLNESHAK